MELIPVEKQERNMLVLAPWNGEIISLYLLIYYTLYLFPSLLIRLHDFNAQ